MKNILRSIMLSCFLNGVYAELPHNEGMMVVPVHGILDRSQYIVLIQQLSHEVNAERRLCACLIGDLEHPRSYDIEDTLSQEQRDGIQRVRDGVEDVCVLHDRDGGEAYVIRVDNIDANMLHISEDDLEMLKDLVKRAFGRYISESAREHLTVVLIAREGSFDEVLKVFAACRPVVGLSNRTSRAPHTFHIVLDRGVTLDAFLEESRKRLPYMYRQLIRETERRALRDGAMCDYMNSANIAKRLLHKDLNLSLMNIDDAQELLLHGIEPVFVAYQDYVAA